MLNMGHKVGIFIDFITKKQKKSHFYKKKPLKTCTYHKKIIILQRSIG